MPGQSQRERFMLVPAACREASEELGLIVAEADLELVCTLHRASTGVDQRRSSIDERADFFVSTRIWIGEPTRREPEKCADLRWLPLIALPDLVVPHELAVLDALRSGEATGGRVPPIMSSGWATRELPRESRRRAHSARSALP